VNAVDEAARYRAKKTENIWDDDEIESELPPRAVSKA